MWCGACIHIHLWDFHWRSVTEKRLGQANLNHQVHMLTQAKTARNESTLATFCMLGFSTLYVMHMINFTRLPCFLWASLKNWKESGYKARSILADKARSHAHCNHIIHWANRIKVDNEKEVHNVCACKHNLGVWMGIHASVRWEYKIVCFSTSSLQPKYVICNVELVVLNQWLYIAKHSFLTTQYVATEHISQ